MSRTLDAARVPLIALLMLMAVAPTLLLAATFTVNSTGDAGDINRGNGVCETAAGNGICTLRAAIEEANALPGLDTIRFGIGSGPVTIAGTGTYFINDPVVIDGTTQPGFVDKPIVEVTGGGIRPANAIQVNSGGGGSTIRGLVVNGWGTPTTAGGGIGLLSNGNMIQGNFIGTDISGTMDRGNNGNGVFVAGTGNIIGGTTPAQRNVISGNHSPGVCLCEFAGSVPTANRIIGNYIGTDLTGQNALGNLNTGVLIKGLIQGAPGNFVGGTNGVSPTRCQGECNVISATREIPTLLGIAHGVAIEGAGATGNQVKGNFIGTDVTGTVDLGNAVVGVHIQTSGNIVGGTTPAERNIISGNDFYGIAIRGDISGFAARNNRVEGNFIGTKANGIEPLPNTKSGVLLAGINGTTPVITTGNSIGGTAAGTGNVISGNGAAGVEIRAAGASGNLVQGNFIGTDITDTANIGNTTDGIFISDANDTAIGGTVPGAPNRISHNGGSGVSVTGTSVRNAIRRNSIHDNSGLGIDLGGDGVTPNDARDGDSGPNDLMNFPDGVMATYDSTANQTVIRGRIDTPDPETVAVDIYQNTDYDASNHGEGETYLDTVMPNADGAFCLTLAGDVRANLTATATNAAGSTSEFSAKTEVELIALEVNQAVQDWTNSVRLIKDKGTYVRAHLQTVDPAGAPIAVGAQLRGFNYKGDEFPDSPLTASNRGGYQAEPNAAARRATWGASLNFKLPASWLDGDVELRLERSDGGNLGCREPGDAGGPAGQCSDCRVKVTFVPTATPKVKLFAINYTSGGKTYAFGISDLDQVSRILTAIYPIATLDWVGVPSGWVGTLPPRVVDVTASMKSLKFWDSSSDSSSSSRVYFGVIPGPADSYVGIADDIPSKAASGYIPDTFFGLGRSTPAHEIGHCLRRAHSVDPALFGFTAGGSAKGACHEPAAHRPQSGVFPNFFVVASPSPLRDAGVCCPRPPPFRMPTLGSMDAPGVPAGDDALVFGLDTSTLFPEVVDPNVYFDMMSYCGVEPRDMWISKFTYEGLQTSIDNTFVVFNPRKASLAGAQSFLIVRGTVDLRTGAVSIAPLFPLTTTVAPEGSPPGSYTLRLLDAADGLIGDIPFAPTALVARGPDPQLATFFIPVPADPAIRKVVVLLNTVPLATRAASANPPTVQVLSPNGGETLSSDPVALSWTGTDPDGDSLLYLVQYSPDGGANWETLLVDHPAQTASIPRSAFKGTANGLIRVMVTDGFDTAQDQSDATFSVPNHVPFVSLWRPTAGEMFAGDQQIVFEASAYDVEDGQLPGGSLQWTSSIDGALGTGRTLLKKASQLSPGTHTITVTATDSVTATGLASVSIQVGVAFPPTFADLSLEQSASPKPPIAGNDLTYTLQVSNLGRDTATAVTLSDTLPSGVAFVSANATPGSCGEAAGVVICNLGSLAKGATATITIVVTPPSAGAITNSATVSAGEVDPAPANNASEWKTTVDLRGMTDLMIEKTVSPDPVPLGGALTYTLQVTNLGGNTAMAPTVSDTLPPGTSFVAASGAGWSCNFASGTLTCTRPSLGIGAAPPIGIALTAPTTPGSIMNTASVSFADPDTNPGNNSGSATTQVGGGGPAGENFHTLTPCRIADTRDPDGPYGGPPLQAATERIFTLTGPCGIPSSAKAVALNATVTGPTAEGYLTLYPGGTPPPLAFTINFGPDQTRANNAIAQLGAGGTLAVISVQATGSVHLILDVVGYFE